MEKTFSNRIEGNPIFTMDSLDTISTIRFQKQPMAVSLRMFACLQEVGLIDTEGRKTELWWKEIGV